MSQETTSGDDYRSGFVALAGLPNVGKSTLMNAVLGQKISAVTSKPQTTRNRILGVHTVEATGQLVFVDTPGIHKASKELNAVMVDNAWGSIGATDVILFIVDAQDALNRSGELSGGNAAIVKRLIAMPQPLVVAINKIDTVSTTDELLPIIGAFSELEGLKSEAIVPISALESDGLDGLVKMLIGLLPPGPQLYPEDIVTDQAERFIAAEIIREKLMLQTRKEIPYASAVTIEVFSDDPSRDLLRMRGIIHVERKSQKGIVIGKGGARLKQIGSQARSELEKFFGRRIYLDLHVKVDRDWSNNPNQLRRQGYI